MWYLVIVKFHDGREANFSFALRLSGGPLGGGGLALLAGPPADGRRSVVQ